MAATKTTVGTRVKRAPNLTAIERRVTRIEARMAEIGSDPPEIALGDVLRDYPDGGIVGLARCIGVNSDTLYDFEKGRARRVRFPSHVATKVAAAFRRARHRPYGITPTAKWLRRAWFALPAADD